MDAISDALPLVIEFAQAMVVKETINGIQWLAQKAKDKIGTLINGPDPRNAIITDDTGT